MKKLFASILCLVALTIVSCTPGALNPSGGGKDVSDMTDADIRKLDNKTEKCWKIKMLISYMGSSDKSEDYMWATEREVAQECKDRLELVEKTYEGYRFDATVKIAYGEVSAKNEDACDKLNGGGSGGGGSTETKMCFYLKGVRLSDDTVLYEKYIWATEEEATAAKEEIEEKYGVFVYIKKQSASGKSECESYNTPGGGGGGGGGGETSKASCYLIKATVSGYTMYDFTMWWTESEAKNFVSKLKSNGYSASYSKASYSSEISCINDYEGIVEDPTLNDSNESCWYFNFSVVNSTWSDSDATEGYIYCTEAYIVNRFREIHIATEERIRGYNVDEITTFQINKTSHTESQCSDANEALNH